MRSYVWITDWLSPGCWSAGDEDDANALFAFNGTIDTQPTADIADEFLTELDEDRMSFAPYITHGPPAGTAAPREGANVVQNPYNRSYSISPASYSAWIDSQYGAFMYDSVMLFARAATQIFADVGASSDTSFRQAAAAWARHREFQKP